MEQTDEGTARETSLEEQLVESNKQAKKAKKAKKIESPTDPIHDISALHKALHPPTKRSANAAFDDRDRSKRLKRAKHGTNEEASPSFPWVKNPKLEQPPSLFDLNRMVTTSANPIAALGDLGKIPAEIRDEIFKYLLVSDTDIKVLQGWSLVYPRAKPNLSVAILRTCSLLRTQGTRVLFAKNTFMYDIKDLPYHRFDTNLVINKVYGGCGIPIDKYGHLIRHIKVHIDRSRHSPSNMQVFANAVKKFLPDSGLMQPANIHTLTLEIPVMKDAEIDNRESRGSTYVWNYFKTMLRDPLLLLNVQFIRVIASLSKDRISAERYEYVVDLRYLHKQRQQDDPDDVMNMGKRDCEAAKSRFEKKARTGEARIRNLPLRIWELKSLGMHKMNRSKGVWKYLGEEKKSKSARDRRMEQWLDDIEM